MGDHRLRWRFPRRSSKSFDLHVSRMTGTHWCYARPCHCGCVWLSKPRNFSELLQRIKRACDDVGSSACYAGREVAIKMSASHLKLERSDMIHASSHCIQSDEEGIKVLFFCPVNILFSICRKTKQQASSQLPLKTHVPESS